MIWLYLLVGCLSFVGLTVVAMERRRGVRQGLVGPLATFLVAFAVSVLAVGWLRALDGDEVRGEPDRVAAVVPSDGDSGEGDSTTEDPGPWWAESRWEPATAQSAEEPSWRSVITKEFVAGFFVTAIFTILGTILNAMTIVRLNRSIERLERRRP